MAWGSYQILSLLSIEAWEGIAKYSTLLQQTEILRCQNQWKGKGLPWIGDSSLCWCSLRSKCCWSDFLSAYNGGCGQSEPKKRQKTSMYTTAWYLRGSKTSKHFPIGSRKFVVYRALRQRSSTWVTCIHMLALAALVCPSCIAPFLLYLKSGTRKQTA